MLLSEYSFHSIIIFTKPTICHHSLFICFTFSFLLLCTYLTQISDKPFLCWDVLKFEFIFVCLRSTFYLVLPYLGGGLSSVFVCIFKTLANRQTVFFVVIVLTQPIQLRTSSQLQLRQRSSWSVDVRGLNLLQVIRRHRSLGVRCSLIVTHSELLLRLLVVTVIAVLLAICTQLALFLKQYQKIY